VVSISVASMSSVAYATGWQRPGRPQKLAVHPPQARYAAARGRDERPSGLPPRLLAGVVEPRKPPARRIRRGQRARPLPSPAPRLGPPLPPALIRPDPLRASRRWRLSEGSPKRRAPPRPFTIVSVQLDGKAVQEEQSAPVRHPIFRRACAPSTTTPTCELPLSAS